MSKEGAKSSNNLKTILNNYENFLKRDAEYTKLLVEYVKNQQLQNEAQRCFKMVFFIVVCAVFLAVVVLGALGIFFIAKKPEISWEDIGAALAGLGSILSVIIVLPSKIAEHLFPSSADQESLKFVQAMQSYDLPFRSGNDESENDVIEMEVK